MLDQLQAYQTAAQPSTDRPPADSPRNDMQEEGSNEWVGDVMGRRAHAAFLTTYIERRVSAGGRSLTVALDAEWGAGKTFFIKNWAEDLERARRGVLVFDAWKNDTTADPVFGFMAELQGGMTVLRRKVPASSKASTALRVTASGMMKSFRKAIVPAGGALAAGLVKKATGVAVGEIRDAISAGDLDFDVDTEDLGKNASDQIEKSLDVFFKRALEDHRSRGKATEAFRGLLETLVVQLQKAEAMEGPLYVFIDELDRCRPDYAIKLLEGVKHLFAVPGVVFIVSTNIEQLGHSIQAIYGAAFDGSSYLKRFFDFESTLPAPENYDFARLLHRNQPAFAKRPLDFGIANEFETEAENITRCFAYIADGFELSLRSQERVWTIASAAAAGVRQQANLALLWLFFLSALKHSHPDRFRDAAASRLTATEFDETVNSIGSFPAFSFEVSEGWGTNARHRTVKLTTVLGMYYRFTSGLASDLIRQWSQEAEDTYPQNLISKHLNQTTSTVHSRKRLEIWNYYGLVQSAGYLKT